MQSLLRVILESGKSAVELTLYVLLPIMVVMMALMRLLEAKGVLAYVARLLAPALRPFGIPGIGVFAMLQLLLVSYAAPSATLALMDRQGASRRELGATLAMILAMSQANAVFPLLAFGLNLPVTLLTSLVGGFAAAAVTYHLVLRSEDGEAGRPQSVAERPQEPQQPVRALDLLLHGGQEGVQLALQAIPSLVLAICLVQALEAAGVILLLERGLSPVLERFGLSGVLILPVVTKYLAGGTAMLGAAMNLLNEGSMSALDLNRIAGFMINPLDLVGIAFLRAAGPGVKEVVRPAVKGALVGILIRGLLHLFLF